MLDDNDGVCIPVYTYVVVSEDPDVSCGPYRDGRDNHYVIRVGQDISVSFGCLVVDWESVLPVHPREDVTEWIKTQGALPGDGVWASLRPSDPGNGGRRLSVSERLRPEICHRCGETMVPVTDMPDAWCCMNRRCRIDQVVDQATREAIAQEADEAYESVDHPDHYGGADNPYEAIKVIEAWDLGFHLGNTVKYISRAGKKDPAKELEDLEKARWYLDRLIANLKGEC